MLGPLPVLAFLISVAWAQDTSEEAVTLDQSGAEVTDALGDLPSQEPRIIFTVPDENPPPPEPVVVPEPPDFQVLSSVENVLSGEGRSIIVHRIAPPDLAIPDPPPPAPAVDTESPEFQALVAAAREKYETRTIVPLSVTVYSGNDHKVSCIRWWHRDPDASAATSTVRRPRMRVIGGETERPASTGYEAWSNVDWNCLRGAAAVEAGGIRYEFFLAISDIDTTRTSRFGLDSIPEHPVIPAELGSFVLSKGDSANAEATAFVRAIHAAYPGQAEELWAAHAIRERWRLEREAWLKANPPQPQDTVIHCSKATKEQAAKIRKLVP
jgi:hypothetical protein